MNELHDKIDFTFHIVQQISLFFKVPNFSDVAMIRISHTARHNDKRQ